MARGEGRGAYFKARYGGGGRGRGRGRGGHNTHADDDISPMDEDSNRMNSADSSASGDWSDLQQMLNDINNKQYGSYKRLQGKYTHSQPNFTLSIDHVQSDAYAPPSRVRSIVPWRETGLPDQLLQSDVSRTALCDFVTRAAASFIRSKQLSENINGSGGGWWAAKGGAFTINAPGQEILPRTSAMIDGNDTLELRFSVALPAAGRTILGREAWKILGVNLVEVVRQSLLWSNLDQAKLEQHVVSALRQHSLREQLANKNLLAFIANGSILPRISGANAFPMDSSTAVPFESPKDLEVTLKAYDGTSITGMGIPRGITLLTGGGFHGKSTLLEAIELGVYNHIPGDGRELVVTDPTAVKIRAEDGRAVSSVDLSPFICNLPGGQSTTQFSTPDASGSTSMAANIQEALEAGCGALLIDEDSSATNLMIRDERMQALIKHEPITPLISKARALFIEHGVSTLIVIGGLGDWLSVADTVIAMDSYRPQHITKQAREVSARYPTTVLESDTYGALPRRALRLDFQGIGTPTSRSKHVITLRRPKGQRPDPAESDPELDLSGLDQVVEKGQTALIAELLVVLKNATRAGAVPHRQLYNSMNDFVGVDGVLPVHLVGGDLVAVRKFELAAAVARLRKVLIVEPMT